MVFSAGRREAISMKPLSAAWVSLAWYSERASQYSACTARSQRRVLLKGRLTTAATLTVVFREILFGAPVLDNDGHRGPTPFADYTWRRE